MGFKKILKKLLTVEFWKWTIIAVMLNIVIVLGLMKTIEDYLCEPLIYNLKRNNVMEITCKPFLFSLIVVAVLDIIGAMFALCSYIKTEPRQDEEMGPLRTYTI